MILLDTHVMLWVLYDPDRLGAESRRAIEDDGRVCFSAVSSAEIAVKRMIGRLDVPADLHTILPDQGLTELALTAAHAAAVEAFPSLVRHNPFDRLLLGQALVEQARFLTVDRRLLGLELPWVLDAAA